MNKPETMCKCGKFCFDNNNPYWRFCPVCGKKKPSPVYYRLLNLGEVLKDGDELWNKCTKEWEPARMSIGITYDPGDDPIRRPIKSYEE